MQAIDRDLEARIRAIAGSASDAAIAREVGCSPGTVSRIRRLAGIPPWRPPAPVLTWPEERLALIGSMPDGELARRWGVSRAAVQAKRIELGRPASDGRVTSIYLSPIILDRLGQEHDTVLSQTYRVSLTAIRHARRRAGLGPGRRVRQVEWTPAMLADLAALPTGMFCRKYAISNRTVAIKRSELHCPSPKAERLGQWTHEMLACLGTASDIALAQAWGMTEDAVRKRRSRLGIPPWRGRDPHLASPAPAPASPIGSEADLLPHDHFTPSGQGSPVTDQSTATP